MARPNEDAGLPSLAEADWLNRPETRAVFDALRASGAEARAVGGAVRNALMNRQVKDVDIATTAVPEEVLRLAKKAGLHAIPTGLEHGTVTIAVKHMPFEVTTLRRDIETFGRHARVTFTTDWGEDARRRDFTMNALYCAADGTVHDPLGGYGDLKERRVRFIGDARERIREDYLRTLRFFRFNAEYAHDLTPDADGVAAAVAEKSGLAKLSGERIRAELLLLLAAPGAVSAARTMHEAGLTEPLIGAGGDVAQLARLVAIEEALNAAPDAILRLAALMLSEASPAQLRERLRLSAAETARLAQAGSDDAAFDPKTDEEQARAFIYRHGADAFTNGALLAWARSGDGPSDEARAERLRLPQRWRAPELPVRGSDVLALGIPAGPAVGSVIAAFEAWWIAQGYPTDQKQIADKLEELARDLA